MTNPSDHREDQLNKPDCFADDVLDEPTLVGGYLASRSEPDDREQGCPSPDKSCLLYGLPLRHKRSDAHYCSPSHRAEASRLRRLRDGHPVDGYGSVAAYFSRRRRRTDGC
jgi:hypothetical protein